MTGGADPVALGFAWKGLVLGLSVAAPVGPISLLCLRRTLQAGFWAGAASGLGTALADACYAAAAAFGLTALSALLLHGQATLRLGGALFLLYLGLRTVVRAPRAMDAAVPAAAPAGGLLRTVAVTFALTMTNPATILSFAAMFAGLGLAGAAGGAAAAALVAGVFAGSMLWWLLLGGTVSLLRRRIGATALRWIDRLSGLALAGLALWLLLAPAVLAPAA